MIKAILFDYDGVISAGVDVSGPPSRLSSNLKIPMEKAEELIRSVWNPFSTSAITEDEVWNKIESQYGNAVDPSMRNVWFTWEEFKPLPQMVNFVRELKTKGYAVGLLSNVLPNMKELIQTNGGYDEFELRTLSCDVGHRKPDPEIFTIALNKFGSMTPDEVLFLDDRESAITTAKDLGFQTILVNDHAEAIRKVRDLIGV